MSVERRKVLEMLAEGKITAEDAEKLLDKLSSPGPTAGNSQEKGAEQSAPGPKKPRYLHIEVNQPGQDQVNMRVPLSLVGGGKRLLSFLPPRVTERLAEHGINFGIFTHGSDEVITQSLQELNVDIQRENGKKVRIFCE